MGDYDNDGYEDLFLAAPDAIRSITTTETGHSPMSRSNRESAASRPDTLSVAAAWFDYDNDGLLDLIVSNYTLWTPQTDRRCAAAGEEYYCDPRLLL